MVFFRQLEVSEWEDGNGWRYQDEITDSGNCDFAGYINSPEELKERFSWIDEFQDIGTIEEFDEFFNYEPDGEIDYFLRVSYYIDADEDPIFSSEIWVSDLREEFKKAF